MAAATTEAVWRENEQNLDHFFTLSHELLCITDFDGSFQEINPAWENTLGWTIGELAGTPFIELIHPDDQEDTLDAVEKLVSGEGTVQVENRYRCRDGSFRWIQWSGVAAPEQRLVYGAGRDITARRQAEESLRQQADELERGFAASTADLSVANDELEAFSYSVSHDLRAPLRRIDGFSQALLEDYSNILDDTGKEYLNRLRAAAQRMGILLDEMLGLSRVSRAELIQVPGDLTAIAITVAAELEEHHPDRQVEFLIDSGLEASCDSRFLRIVLENLLGNAFRYTSTRAPARIEFGCERVDGAEAFFVRDNGIGFDMTYADQLFVPFQRLHTEPDPGSGIGLATVQRIIHRHGGHAWAHGEVGTGATFYFTLRAGTGEP